jgi:glutaminyl-peptide cyclotransferase
MSFFRPVFFVSLATVLTGCGPAQPSAKPAPPASTFHATFTTANGSNALARVVALCALGPRDTGTPGGERAANWLADSLRQQGYSPRVDSFTNDTATGPLINHNVYAECAGLKNTENSTNSWIILISHFDTKTGVSTNFVGANDGGSSTALLLELAQIIKTASPRGNVMFGFLDGEECRVEYGPRDGLHGSRHLAAQLAAEKRNVRAVILLDMIGKRNVSVQLPPNGDVALTRLVLEAAKTCGVREKFGLSNFGVLDDHQPFLDAGFPAVDLIDFHFGSAIGLNNYWHTPQDTTDKLSAESLTIIGRVVTEMLRQID